MARENKTRDGINAQKRGVCVAVIPFVEADVLVDGLVGVDLPEDSVITNVIVQVETVSTTGSSTVDVLIGAAVLANEIAVTAAGAIVGTLVAAVAEATTGGELIIKSGSTAPAAGDLVGTLIVEYIELNKTTGEYTNFLAS